jgi:hypothetical protein
MRFAPESGGAQCSGQTRASIKVVLDMGSNTLVDQVAELRIVK